MLALSTNVPSSVDAHTDELIQRVMKERFSNHTVLSIVHKLESALDDFDLVAVLDAGVLVEFGSPRELLQQGADKSPFAALYESLTSKAQSAKDGNAAGSGQRGSGSSGDDTISPLS